MRIFTFGCYKGKSGHFCRRLVEDKRGNQLVTYTISAGHEHERPLKDRIGRFDGVLPPIDPHEREGRIASHVIHGFTVLAWWDRSIDTRMACNQAVWVEGHHTPQEALAIAHDKLPAEFFEPFDYDLVLVSADVCSDTGGES